MITERDVLNLMLTIEERKNENRTEKKDKQTNDKSTQVDIQKSTRLF